MSLTLSDYDGTYDKMSDKEKAKIDAIVTGASWEEADRIEADVPIFYNPVPLKKKDTSNIISHKANIINKTEATDFYENDQQEANMLKILCPDCTIHKV
jgi:hypothetical protein